jgi:hypothetical protein
MKLHGTLARGSVTDDDQPAFRDAVNKGVGLDCNPTKNGTTGLSAIGMAGNAEGLEQRGGGRHQKNGLVKQTIELLQYRGTLQRQ